MHYAIIHSNYAAAFATSTQKYNGHIRPTTVQHVDSRLAQTIIFIDAVLSCYLSFKLASYIHLIQ
jgi:hypothetical protein